VVFAWKRLRLKNDIAEFPIDLDFSDVLQRFSRVGICRKNPLLFRGQVSSPPGYVGPHGIRLVVDADRARTSPYSAGQQGPIPYGATCKM
jgi:hypothetical protein